jgi:hypothetical protein
MRDASICGLGQAASNPLTSVMRYFPELFTGGATLSDGTATADAVATLHGIQRGSVTVPPDFDWTAPVLERGIEDDKST